MPTSFTIDAKTYPTLGTFRISRSSVNAVHVVQVTLKSDGVVGRGECRPYARYDQTVESVTAALESVRQDVDADGFETALDSLASEAAHNALESAWIDLRAKQSGQSAASLLNVKAPVSRETAFTLSWGSIDDMTQAAKAASAYPWLKIKIGIDGLEHVQAVASARPDARLIIDANEALTPADLPQFLSALSGLNIALIEQPLPAGHSEILPETDLIICADEGLHSIDDLDRLWSQGYRAVNVKMDKCGGPIAARDLILKAKSMGFIIMAGCMVGSSLAMAPMLTLESLCDIIDLDGPLLLASDIEQGLSYDGAIVSPPSSELWG
jgi:L-alanine-DL-glutamate epimerase-like enolase superfamily enzyme